LASAEIATAGLVAEWLAKARDGHLRLYRGGLVAADEAALLRLLPVESIASSHGESFVRTVALACREQFQADFGLAVGPLPPTNETGEAGQVHFALASEAGVETFHASCGIHPDIVADYCAKQAINLARLVLLKTELAQTPCVPM
jgi:nicotinamide mononucleotide (NMN) deamidase PncC